MKQESNSPDRTLAARRKSSPSQQAPHSRVRVRIRVRARSKSQDNDIRVSLRARVWLWLWLWLWNHDLPLKSRPDENGSTLHNAIVLTGTSFVWLTVPISSISISGGVRFALSLSNIPLPVTGEGKGEGKGRGSWKKT
jgi:hypothetical protein